jgi:hypothetical protein
VTLTHGKTKQTRKLNVDSPRGLRRDSRNLSRRSRHGSL